MFKSKSEKVTKSGAPDVKDKEVKRTDEEIELADWTFHKLKEAMLAKSSFTKRWEDYEKAYMGDYFEDKARPSYKSNQISNFIFSTIETIRPIMVDNNPKFIALPRKPEGEEIAPKIQTAFDYEWDREKMDIKLPKSLITALVQGTNIFGLFWNGKEGKYGEINCVPINPYNFYPDPMATSIEDAEIIQYAVYKNVNFLKKVYPKKANLLEGGDIKYEELVANRKPDQPVDNQVLVVETWCRDYTTVESEEKDKDGNTIKTKKLKNPNGRIIVSAPELQLVLDDKPNPYNDGRFPFVLLKDYDIPFQFWGEGEVRYLLSPQESIIDLNNQIIDNAKLTANMPWIVDKNAGIGYGKLTNRPGLVIRKNPGAEVRRDAPPPMPSYVGEKIIELKGDMESISGIHDVTSGKRPTGIQAGNAIMALQEAGQTRIRLKVKLMETSLAELATMWYSRMQQFWKLDRWTRVVGESGEVNFAEIKSDDLKHDFDILVTAGSTMPLNKSAMLDLMIRLAQTPAEDGMPVVDRSVMLDYVPQVNKAKVLQHFAELKEEQMQMAQAEQEQVAQQEQEQAQAQGQEQVMQVVQELGGVVQELQTQVQTIMQMFGGNQVPPQGMPQEMPPQQPQPSPEEMAMMERQMMEEQMMMEQGMQGMPQQPSSPLPPEVMEQIATLSPEELQILIEEYPELEEILANNPM